MWVFLGLTIDFSEIRVFANKGCTETHLICVSQTSRGSVTPCWTVWRRRLEDSYFLISCFLFCFFFCMPHFPTCITKCVLQSILAIFRSPDRKKNEKERRRRKTKNENQLGFNGRSMYRAEDSF